MKELHIGLVLSALPSYSETFIVSKIRCLVESRFIVSLFVDNYSMGLKEHPFVIEFINSKGEVIKTETLFWKGKPTVWDGHKGRYVYKNRLIHSSEKNQQSALYVCLKAIKRQEEIRKDC